MANNSLPERPGTGGTSQPWYLDSPEQAALTQYLNLTTGFGESQAPERVRGSRKDYPYGFAYGRDNEDYQAMRQGPGKQLGNALVRTVAGAGIKFMEGLGTIPAFIASGGDLDAAYDNAWASVFGAMEDSLKEALPVYKTRAALDGNILQKMGQVSWWADDFADGLAFMGSALIPGGIMSRAGGIFSRLARTMSYTTRAARTGRAMQVGMNPNVAKIFQQMDMATLAAFQSANEASFEARDTKESVMRSLAPKILSGEMTPAEARERAGQAARNTFKWNMGALMVSNYIMDSMIWGQFSGGRRAIDKSARDVLTGAAEALPQQTRWQRAWPYLRNFGKGSLSEGAYEENLQLAVQDYYGDAALDVENLPGPVAGIARNMLNNFTTDEGQEAIVLGALIGLGPGVVGSRNEVKAEKTRRSQFSKMLAATNARYNAQLNAWVKTKEDGTPELDSNGNPVPDVQKMQAALLGQMSSAREFEMFMRAAEENNTLIADFLADRALAQQAFNIFQSAEEAGYDGQDAFNMWLEGHSEDIAGKLNDAVVRFTADGKPLKAQDVQARYRTRGEQMYRAYRTIQNRHGGLLATQPGVDQMFARALIAGQYQEATHQQYLTALGEQVDGAITFADDVEAVTAADDLLKEQDKARKAVFAAAEKMFADATLTQSRTDEAGNTIIGETPVRVDPFSDENPGANTEARRQYDQMKARLKKTDAYKKYLAAEQEAQQSREERQKTMRESGKFEEQMFRDPVALRAQINAALEGSYEFYRELVSKEGIERLEADWKADQEEAYNSFMSRKPIVEAILDDLQAKAKAEQRKAFNELLNTMRQFVEEQYPKGKTFAFEAGTAVVVDTLVTRDKRGVYTPENALGVVHLRLVDGATEQASDALVLVRTMIMPDGGLAFVVEPDILNDEKAEPAWGPPTTLTPRRAKEHARQFWEGQSTRSAQAAQQNPTPPEGPAPEGSKPSEGDGTQETKDHGPPLPQMFPFLGEGVTIDDATKITGPTMVRFISPSGNVAHMLVSRANPAKPDPEHNDFVVLAWYDAAGNSMRVLDTSLNPPKELSTQPGKPGADMTMGVVPKYFLLQSEPGTVLSMVQASSVPLVGQELDRLKALAAAAAAPAKAPEEPGTDPQTDPQTDPEEEPGEGPAQPADTQSGVEPGEPTDNPPDGPPEGPPDPPAGSDPQSPTKENEDLVFTGRVVTSAKRHTQRTERGNYTQPTEYDAEGQPITPGVFKEVTDEAGQPLGRHPSAVVVLEDGTLLPVDVARTFFVPQGAEVEVRIVPTKYNAKLGQRTDEERYDNMHLGVYYQGRLIQQVAAGQGDVNRQMLAQQVERDGVVKLKVYRKHRGAPLTAISYDEQSREIPLLQPPDTLKGLYNHLGGEKNGDPVLFIIGGVFDREGRQVLPGTASAASFTYGDKERAMALTGLDEAALDEAARAALASGMSFKPGTPLLVVPTPTGFTFQRVVTKKMSADPAAVATVLKIAYDTRLNGESKRARIDDIVGIGESMPQLPFAKLRDGQPADPYFMYATPEHVYFQHPGSSEKLLVQVSWENLAANGKYTYVRVSEQVRTNELGKQYVDYVPVPLAQQPEGGGAVQELFEAQLKLKRRQVKAALLNSSQPYYDEVSNTSYEGGYMEFLNKQGIIRHNLLAAKVEGEGTHVFENVQLELTYEQDMSVLRPEPAQKPEVRPAPAPAPSDGRGKKSIRELRKAAKKGGSSTQAKPATPAAPESTSKLEEAKALVELMKARSKQFIISEDKNYYLDTTTGKIDPATGKIDPATYKKYIRMSRFINLKEPPDKALVQSSLRVGSKVDSFARDIFAGKVPLKPSKELIDSYGFMSADAGPELYAEVEQFVKDLLEVKATMLKRGEVPVTDEITLYDEVAGIAGTVDMLTYDKHGVFRIYDFKTMRKHKFSEQWYGTDYTSEKFGMSDREKHQRQLSGYRILAHNTYGVLAKSLAIIPIKVSYPDDGRLYEHTWELRFITTKEANKLNAHKPLDKLERTGAEGPDVLQLRKPSALPKLPTRSTKRRPAKAARSATGAQGKLFRSAPTSEQTIEQGQARSWLAKTFGKGLSVKVYDNMMRLADNKVAHGYFDSYAVHLWSQAEVGTEYHEGFHVAFRALLSPSERESLYADARKKYGKDLSLLELEEAMAEGFRDYMLGIKDRSLGQRILDFFEGLWATLKAWVTGRTTIDAMYRSMASGTVRLRAFNIERKLSRAPSDTVFSSQRQRFSQREQVVKQVADLVLQGETLLSIGTIINQTAYGISDRVVATKAMAARRRLELASELNDTAAIERWAEALQKLGEEYQGDAEFFFDREDELEETPQGKLLFEAGIFWTDQYDSLGNLVFAGIRREVIDRLRSQKLRLPREYATDPAEEGEAALPTTFERSQVTGLELDEETVAMMARIRQELAEQEDDSVTEAENALMTDEDDFSDASQSDIKERIFDKAFYTESVDSRMSAELRQYLLRVPDRQARGVLPLGGDLMFYELDELMPVIVDTVLDATSYGDMLQRLSEGWLDPRNPAGPALTAVAQVIKQAPPHIQAQFFTTFWLHDLHFTKMRSGRSGVMTLQSSDTTTLKSRLLREWKVNSYSGRQATEESIYYIDAEGYYRVSQPAMYALALAPYHGDSELTLEQTILAYLRPQQQPGRPNPKSDPATQFLWDNADVTPALASAMSDYLRKFGIDLTAAEIDQFFNKLPPQRNGRVKRRGLGLMRHMLGDFFKLRFALTDEQAMADGTVFDQKFYEPRHLLTPTRDLQNSLMTIKETLGARGALAFLSADNKLFYRGNMRTPLEELVEQIAQGNIDQLAPWDNDVAMANSPLLPILRMPGVFDKMGTTRLDALQRRTAEGLDRGDASEMGDALNVAHRILYWLNNGDSEHAYFVNHTLGDRTAEIAIRFPKLKKLLQERRLSTQRTYTDVFAQMVRAEIQSAMDAAARLARTDLTAEQVSMLQSMSRLRLVEAYVKDEQGNVLIDVETFAREALQDPDAVDIEDVIDTLATRMRQAADARAQRDYELLDEGGFLKPEETFVDRGALQGYLQTTDPPLLLALRDYHAENIIFRGEWFKFTATHLGLYGNAQANEAQAYLKSSKRASLLATPGYGMLESGQMSNVNVESYNYGASSTVTTAFFADPRQQMAAEERDALAATLSQWGMDKAVALAMLKPYVKGSNKTDAFSVHSLSEHRFMMMGTGEWTDAHEDAYRNYQRTGNWVTTGNMGTYINKATGLYEFGARPEDQGGTVAGQRPKLLPRKPFTDALIYDEKMGRVVRFVEKHASIPLLREWTKDYPVFDDLRKRLEAGSDNTLIEGEKNGYVGLPRLDRASSQEGGKAYLPHVLQWDGEQALPFAGLQGVTYARRYQRFPQITPDKDKQEARLASQTKDNVLDNIHLNGEYKVDGVLMTGQTMMRAYHGLLRSWLVAQANEHLGRYPGRYGEHAFMVKLRDELLDYVQEQGLDDTFTAALTLKANEDGQYDFAVPLAWPPLRSVFESFLFSRYRKNVIDLKIKGAGYVQIGELGGHAIDGELKFLRVDGTAIKGSAIDKVDGRPTIAQNEVLAAEVAIPYSLAKKYGLKPGDALDQMPEELRRGVGYRIPNQGHNSTIALIVAKVLPEYMGDVVMVPGHITTQQGSDFDYDKLYIMLPSLRRDEAGNLVKDRVDWTSAAELFEGEGLTNDLADQLPVMSRAQLQNAVIDVMYAIMSSPHHLEQTLRPLDGGRHKALAAEVIDRGLGQAGVFRLNLAATDPGIDVFIDRMARMGNQMIGIFANYLKAQTMLQYGDIRLSSPLTINVGVGNNKQAVKVERINARRANPLLDGQKDTLVSFGLSEYLSDALDNQKDPIVFWLGVTLQNINMVGMLASAGVGPRIVRDLLQQPMVRRVFQRMANEQAQPHEYGTYAAAVVKDFGGTEAQQRLVNAPLPPAEKQLDVEVLADMWTKSTVRPADRGGTDFTQQLKILRVVKELMLDSQQYSNVVQATRSDRVRMSSFAHAQSFMLLAGYPGSAVYAQEGKPTARITGFTDFVENQRYPLWNTYRDMVDLGIRHVGSVLPIHGQSFIYALQAFQTATGRDRLTTQQIKALEGEWLYYLASQPDGRHAEEFNALFGADQVRRAFDPGVMARITQLSRRPGLAENEYAARLGLQYRQPDTPLQLLRFERDFGETGLQAKRITDALREVLYVNSPLNRDDPKHTARRMLGLGVITQQIHATRLQSRSHSMMRYMPAEQWEEWGVLEPFRERLYRSFRSADSAVVQDFLARLISNAVQSSRGAGRAIVRAKELQPRIRKATVRASGAFMGADGMPRMLVRQYDSANNRWDGYVLTGVNESTGQLEYTMVQTLGWGDDMSEYHLHDGDGNLLSTSMWEANDRGPAAINLLEQPTLLLPMGEFERIVPMPEMLPGANDIINDQAADDARTDLEC